MPTKDGSHVALKQPQQDSLSRTPIQSLLCDPAFPVPATLAEPCLPGPPLACQDVQEDSFLAGWWSGVLDAAAVRDPAASTSSNGPGLQKRLRRLQQRSHTLFDLSEIHAQLVQVVQNNSANCLDLPRFTGKAQKREVKALGALYGFQPRNCGRKGTTLFKTEHAGLPDARGAEKVAALLLNSKATQQHSHAPHGSELRGKRAKKKAKRLAKLGRRNADNQDQALGHGAADTDCLGPIAAAPLDSSNIGSRMLVSMGWEAGTGLGASLQGQVEPVPVIKRRKRLGLGA